MLVAGVILFVTLVFMLINGSLLPQVEGDIENNSQILASLKAGLTATPSPSVAAPLPSPSVAAPLPSPSVAAPLPSPSVAAPLP